MKYVRLAAAITLGVLHLHAQTPVAGPATGPTMEQTVAFINDSLAKQDDTQSVQLENACSLVISQTLSSSDGKIYFRYALLLDHSDPLSVSVVTAEPGEGQTVFSVEIQRAVIQRRALDIPPGTVAEVLSGNYGVSGVVRSVSSNSLTIVTDSGKLTTLTLDGNVEIHQGQNVLPAAVSDIAAGDYINGYRQSSVQTITALHHKAKLRPQEIPSGTVAEALSGTYGFEDADGVALSVSGNVLTILRDGGKLITLKLDTNTTIRITNEEGLQHPGAITDIVAGDFIYAAGTRSKQSFSLIKSSRRQEEFAPARFTDKDLAERVAKAYIHAIVLCHNDAKPSLF